MATKGNILTSNFSSADNPLAHPGMQRYQPSTATQSSPSNNNRITKPAAQPATGGGVVKSNFSSSDNPLVNPAYSHEAQQQRQTAPQKITQSSQPNPGGLVKSNVLSSDNPFTNPSSYEAMPPAPQMNSMPTPSPEQWRKVNNNYEAPQKASTYEPSSSLANGPYYPQTMSMDSMLPPISSQPTSSTYFPSIDAYQKSSYQPSFIASTDTYFPSNTNSNKPSYSYNEEPSLLNYSSFVRNDAPTQYQPSSYQDNYPKNGPPRSPLDTLVAEKSDQEVDRFLDEKNRQRMEQELFDQKYPLAKRNSIINDLKRSKPDSMTTTYNSSYQALTPGQGNVFPRLSKDMIVEKPNSLSADVPPYDPIKYKNGFPQGYNYDPWGKPGGGAPLIDPTTGRKFTKISGQVWYDTLGMSPDDRARAYLDKNRPLTLEEQKYEMELEKERRRYDEAVYKSRAGDVATWINDLENTRAKAVRQNAHLAHTNVTRDKINVEYARRANLNESTKAYHDELQSQLEEREREHKLHKLRDNIAGIEHVKRWDDWVSVHPSIRPDLLPAELETSDPELFFSFQVGKAWRWSAESREKTP